MENEFKDHRLKYVELPRIFSHMSHEIKISSKQHLRACEKLAKHISGVRPKNGREFEQNEWMKEFVVKTADLNEKTLCLIDNMAKLLSEIAQDARSIIDGTELRNQARDQSDAIIMLQNTRDLLVKELYEFKKHELEANKRLN